MAACDASCPPKFSSPPIDSMPSPSEFTFSGRASARITGMFLCPFKSSSKSISGSGNRMIAE